MSTRYVVSVYRPGYLSEGEPYVTESLEDAIGVLVSEIRDTIDSIEDDAEFLAADTALHTANLDAKAREALTRPGGYGYTYDVAGYRHAIEPCPDLTTKAREALETGRQLRARLAALSATLELFPH